jgi:hypothetical protein
LLEIIRCALFKIIKACPELVAISTSLKATLSFAEWVEELIRAIKIIFLSYVNQ